MNEPTVSICGKSKIALWLMFLAAGTAQAQIDCGTENGAPCNPNSNWLWSVYYNQGPYNSNHAIQVTPPYYFSDNACDLALTVNKDGYCSGIIQSTHLSQGGERHLIANSLNPPGSWIDFAMKQQRYGVQSDQAMNWITTFGTYNSYSNYQDGAFDVNLSLIQKPPLNLNVDQVWSIYDQLDAGARYIRLDPITYDVVHGFNSDTELRVCHQSASGTTTNLECNLDSYGRLFSYALAEVREWLDNNPGEVLVIRLYRTLSSDLHAIDVALDNELEAKGDYILPPPHSPYGNLWDPTTQGWPTLRQMRSMDRRLIILSDTGTPLYAYPWSWVQNDGYSDEKNGDFQACKNVDGNYVPARAFNLWSYIGEDRSGSNSFAAVPGAGKLDETNVTTAVNCGYSIVNVDFLLALNHAAHNETSFCLPFSSDCLNTFDYRSGSQSADDHRREAAIWSWDENDFGANGPAYSKPNGRWGSLSADTPFRFACAVGQGSPQEAVNYTWLITKVGDKWSAGPQRCKEVGGKFWAPQSAIENAYLRTAVKTQALDSPVWINYSASFNPILEPVSPQLTEGSTARSFVINVIQGQSGAALSPTFQFTGGTGSAFVVKIRDAHPAIFSASAVGYLTKTLSFTAATSAVDSQGNVTLAPGSYTQEFTLIEQQGNNSPSVQDFTVTVNVAAAVNITVDSEPHGEILYVDNTAYVAPHTFAWIGGDKHTLNANNIVNQPGEKQKFLGWTNGTTAPSFSYTVPSGNATLEAKFDQYFQLTLTTTGSGTVTAAPASADGYYLKDTHVSLQAAAKSGYYFSGFSGALSGKTNPQQVTMSQALAVVAAFSQTTTIKTNLAAANLITVDGVPVQPGTFNLDPASPHSVGYPAQLPRPGEHLVFLKWSDGDVSNPRSIAPGTSYTINVADELYVGATAAPAAGGSVSGGGWYPSGKSVTLTATAAGGYAFGGFSGDLKSATSPQTFTVSAPMTIAANFTAQVPQLNANALVIDDKSPIVKLGLTFSNTGLGSATQIQITSATITAASSTGAVTLSTPLPLAFGNLAGGATSPSVEMDLAWPTPVSRIKLTINYNANGGSYQSTQNLNLFR
jgi:Divergent InlB B-repeat domain